MNGQVEYVYYCTCSYCGMVYIDREDKVEKSLTEDKKHDIESEKIQ